MKKLVSRAFIQLILCVLAGGLLITVANYLPVNPVNRAASLSELSSEYAFPDIAPVSGNKMAGFHSMSPTTLELATDNLMIQMASYDGADQGIRQAFRCYDTVFDVDYGRYWHGYVVFLRPLLLLFDYYQIRILNGICQLLLFCAVFHSLGKQAIDKRYPLALATSYILLMPQALGQCLQYSWIFYVAFGSLLLYLRYKKYWDKENHFVLFFLLVGSVTCYLDLLTYPLLTWGLAAVWWILLKDESVSVWRYVRDVVYSGLSWIAGYAGMWIGKWILGSVVLRENLFSNAFFETLVWTVNSEDSAYTLSERISVLVLNWKPYMYRLYLIILVAWVLYWLLKSLSGYRKNSKIPALLLIGSSSIVWHFILVGHSQMHHLFTHRTYSVSIAAFLGIVLLSTKSSRTFAGGRERIQSLMIAAASCILALILMFQFRDTYSVKNWDFLFRQVTVTTPVSTTFTPDFSNLTEINLGFMAEDGAEGDYIIQLLDGDTLVQEIRIAAADCAEGGTFRTFPVAWRLRPGHPYTLSLQAEKDGYETYLWVTEDGNAPLAEYGAVLRGDGVEIAGQWLAGVTYWCRPVGREACLFWGATILSILLMAICSIRSCLGRS